MKSGVILSYCIHQSNREVWMENFLNEPDHMNEWMKKNRGQSPWTTSRWRFCAYMVHSCLLTAHCFGRLLLLSLLWTKIMWVSDFSCCWWKKPPSFGPESETGIREDASFLRRRLQKSDAETFEGTLGTLFFWNEKQKWGFESKISTITPLIFCRCISIDLPQTDFMLKLWSILCFSFIFLQKQHFSCRKVGQTRPSLCWFWSSQICLVLLTQLFRWYWALISFLINTDFIEAVRSL